MKTPRSPLSEAIRAASEAKAAQANQTSGLPESKNTSYLDATREQNDLMVNLSIKVSRCQRLHWLVEAKRHGTSLTEAIIIALNTRFGDTPKE